MSDATATKEDYLKVCTDLGREADVEILAVLNSAVDDSFLWVENFYNLFRFIAFTASHSFMIIFVSDNSWSA